jgi:hypothetical protein
MSYTTQRNTIQTQFKTAFELAYPGVPIVFDNIKSDKPINGFIMLNILNGASALRGLGLTKLYRYAGVVSVDIYIPSKTGLQLADHYADTIDAIFRGQQFGGLLFRASTRTDLGDDDNYWRVNISAPFQRDELI